MRYSPDQNPYIRSIRLEPIGKDGAWRVKVRFHAIREIQRKVSLENEDISSLKDIKASVVDRLEFAADTLEQLGGIKARLRKKDPVRFRAVNVKEEDVGAVYAALMMADFIDYADLYDEMEEAHEIIEEHADSRFIAKHNPQAATPAQAVVIPFRKPTGKGGKKDSPSSSNNTSSTS